MLVKKWVLILCILLTGCTFSYSHIESTPINKQYITYLNSLYNTTNTIKDEHPCFSDNDLDQTYLSFAYGDFDQDHIDDLMIISETLFNGEVSYYTYHCFTLNKDKVVITYEGIYHTCIDKPIFYATGVIQLDPMSYTFIKEDIAKTYGITIMNDILHYDIQGQTIVKQEISGDTKDISINITNGEYHKDIESMTDKGVIEIHINNYTKKVISKLK